MYCYSDYKSAIASDLLAWYVALHYYVCYIPNSTKHLGAKTFAVRSPCEYSQKNFAFAAKQRPQVPEHFEICGKTFAVQAKTMKVLALKRFVL